MSGILIGKNFYGSVPEEIMKEFNQKIKDTYWRVALEQSEGFLKRKKDWFISKARINFFPYLDLKKEDMALDVGAGSGVISEGLSKKIRQVISLEKGEENVIFIKRRFEQDNLKNIAIMRGNALDLPFKDSTFNIVILNGVLEWLPNSDIKINPEMLQLNGLKEFFRVLKDGGQLYIGVENRFFFRYFLGEPDPHCGLRWVTILPRILARMYSRLKIKIPYVNYLYTRRGYAKMLKKAGFTETDFYWPIEDYNDIRTIIPLNKKIIKYYFRNFYSSDYVLTIKSVIKTVLRSILPFEMRVSSFIIIAKKC